MAGITTQINDFHKNKFQVRFSNIPNFTGRDIDIHVVDNYITAFNVPDISIPMLTSISGHLRQLHPNTIGSRDLQTINLEMKIDEHMYNWWLMYSWLYKMRHGATSSRTAEGTEPLVRMDSIDTIELCLLDNDGHIVSKLRFHQCILSNISSLDLKFSDAETGTMVLTFEVEEMSFDVETEED